MITVNLDFETYSEANIKNVGAYAYASHPSTEPICCAYQIDGGGVKLWKFGDAPPEFTKFDYEATTFTAYNSFFEYCVWHFCLASSWGEPPAFDHWSDTMAMTAALSLPRALGNACVAVGMPKDKQKDARGKQLIAKLCGPQRNGARNRDPELLKELYAYCEQDVVAETELRKRLLKLTPTEQRVWVLDQVINWRGAPVALRDVGAALDMIDILQEDFSNEVKRMTGGALENTNSRDQVMQYCRDVFGYELPSYRKHDLELVLSDQKLPSGMRALLEIRLQSGKISTKKYEKLRDLARYDGRAHGVLMYHGADTGRWAGRGFQPQNLPRPTIDDPTSCADLIATGDVELIELLHGAPMEALSSCVRSMIKAKAGHRLIVADYSAIEARGVAWLAGEDSILRVFEGDGKIYEHAAGGIFHVSPKSVSKDSLERQIGKVAILALGYQGGYRAFVTMGSGYGLDLEEVAKSATPEQREEMADIKRWFSKNRVEEVELADGVRVETAVELTNGEAFAELVKRNWREANPNIVSYWYDTETAAMNAIREPGTTWRCGKCAFRVVRGTLFCRLPSGRKLAYHHAKIERNRWGKDVIGFVGNDDKGNWVKQQTYGGKLVENQTQAVARDLLAEALLRVEAKGYPVVLHVHDEIIAEVPNGFGSLQEFEALMCELPEWAAGFPVAAEGYEAMRYRK